MKHQMARHGPWGSSEWKSAQVLHLQKSLGDGDKFGDLWVAWMDMRVSFHKLSRQKYFGKFCPIWKPRTVLGNNPVIKWQTRTVDYS